MHKDTGYVHVHSCDTRKQEDHKVPTLYILVLSKLEANNRYTYAHVDGTQHQSVFSQSLMNIEWLNYSDSVIRY